MLKSSWSPNTFRYGNLNLGTLFRNGHGELHQPTKMEDQNIVYHERSESFVLRLMSCTIRSWSCHRKHFLNFLRKMEEYISKINLTISTYDLPVDKPRKVLLELYRNSFFYHCKGSFKYYVQYFDHKVAYPLPTLVSNGSFW